MQRLSSFIAVVCLSLAAMAGPARASGGCAPVTKAPEVRVHVWDADILYDFDHTADQIGALAQAAGTLHAGMQNWVVRGLTVARFMVKTQVGTLRSKAPDGLGWCSRISTLDAWVGYQDPFTVYVQSEFPPGTCQHRAILDHEHMHVRINRETLVAHLSEMRDALLAVARGDGYGVYSPDAESGPKDLLALTRTALDAATEAETVDRTSRHAQLDSDASLEWTKEQCSSW